MPQICTVPTGDQKEYCEKRPFGGYYTITSSGNALNIVERWSSGRGKASTQVASFLRFLNCPVTATLGDVMRD